MPEELCLRLWMGFGALRLSWQRRAERMLDLFLLLALGYGGFWLFSKLGLPSPPILGPLFLVAAVHLAGLFSFDGLPPNLTVLFTVGVAISVCQDFVFTGREGWPELLAVIVYSLLVGFAAFGILAGTGMEPATALFSSVPGGGTDLALIAMGFEGADSFRVVLYQTIRFFMVVLLYPVLVPRLLSLARYLDQRKTGKLTVPSEAGADPERKGDVLISPEPALAEGPVKKYRSLPFYAHISLLVSIYCFGLFLAWVFNSLHINGGTYLGGMAAILIASPTLRCRFHIKPAMSRKTATFFKIGAMSLLGLSITWSSLTALVREWPAVLVTSVFIVLAGVVLGWIFYRLGRFDLVTSLLVTAPGGVLPMSIMAEEMGCDAVKVSLFQMLRIVVLVLLAPGIGSMFL